MLAWLGAGALVALVAVRAVGGEDGTVLALLVGALPLTLLPAYALLVVGAVARRRALVVVSTGLVLAHLLVVAPALGAAPLPTGVDDAPRLRVVVANLYVLNPDPERAGRALRALRPDVLVVPELNAAGLAGLRAAGLLGDLPHTTTQGGDREESVGLFSRLPLRDTSTRVVGGRELPRGTVDVGGVAVRLLAVHPLPPVSVFEGLWRAALADLLSEVKALEGPAVVAGDFNADRDHAPFRRLLGDGLLRDAHDERGRGLARTFPAAAPFLHLDHVLVGDGADAQVVVRDVQEFPIPGSDHLGVVADLAVLRRRAPAR